MQEGRTGSNCKTGDCPTMMGGWMDGWVNGCTDQQQLLRRMMQVECRKMLRCDVMRVGPGRVLRDETQRMGVQE